MRWQISEQSTTDSGQHFCPVVAERNEKKDEGEKEKKERKKGKEKESRQKSRCNDCVSLSVRQRCYPGGL